MVARNLLKVGIRELQEKRAKKQLFITSTCMRVQSIGLLNAIQHITRDGIVLKRTLPLLRNLRLRLIEVQCCDRKRLCVLLQRRCSWIHPRKRTCIYANLTASCNGQMQCKGLVICCPPASSDSRVKHLCDSELGRSTPLQNSSVGR